MYTPSFVKIPDGGLKITKKLVELTWNDPYTGIPIFGLIFTSTHSDVLLYILMLGVPKICVLFSKKAGHLPPSKKCKFLLYMKIKSTFLWLKNKNIKKP